jgi:hypothetical protein
MPVFRVVHRDGSAQTWKADLYFVDEREVEIYIQSMEGLHEGTISYATYAICTDGKGAADTHTQMVLDTLTSIQCKAVGVFK